ncbi:MAG: hypothetical protein AB7S26_42615 [Sandaracinaceae bacterium]
MALLLLVVAVAPRAAAQEEGGSSERAEALFNRGMEALEGLRFADARDRFRASLGAYPNGATAFNLGLAYRGLGESRAAIEVWSGLLDGRYGELAGEQLEEVSRLVAEERTRLARLEVRTTVDAPLSVRIDGEDMDEIAPESRQIYVLDAGRHILVGRAEGFEVAERTVQLTAGEDERLTLTLAPQTRVDGAIYEEAWFWTVLGVLVLGGAAAGVLAGVFLYADPQPTAPFGVVRTP